MMVFKFGPLFHLTSLHFISPHLYRQQSLTPPHLTNIYASLVAIPMGDKMSLIKGKKSSTLGIRELFEGSKRAALSSISENKSVGYT